MRHGAAASVENGREELQPVVRDALLRLGGVCRLLLRLVDATLIVLERPAPARDLVAHAAATAIAIAEARDIFVRGAVVIIVGANGAATSLALLIGERRHASRVALGRQRCRRYRQLEDRREEAQLRESDAGIVPKACSTREGLVELAACLVTWQSATRERELARVLHVLVRWRHCDSADTQAGSRASSCVVAS